eukprot:TRINITY_DN2040_c1_g2_i1.p1 TRINITY_DN2040_c1_g2~~TRINITY_DN2040_c1_g2_i1.p1  ORF type:complete len:258 (+),score=14.07 TRINITY_DN2040_c1_g2_i1:53-826(+)
MEVSRSVTHSLEDVCEIVEAVLVRNNSFGHAHESHNPLAFFDCVSVPKISFTGYVKQLSKLKCDDLWLPALILADRFLSNTKTCLNPHNVHRLMLVSYAVAAKSCYDIKSVNKAVSRYGSVGLEDLNVMERAFLTMVDWNVRVSEQDFQTCAENLGAIKEAASLPPSEVPAPLVPESVLNKSTRQGWAEPSEPASLKLAPSPPSGPCRPTRARSGPNARPLSPVSAPDQHTGEAHHAQRGHRARILEARSFASSCHV